MKLAAIEVLASMLVAAGCAGPAAAGKPAASQEGAPAARPGAPAPAAPAAGGRAKAGDAFPTPEALARLAERPAPERLFAEGEDPDGFTLEGIPPRPPSQADHQPAGPWDQLLAAEVARSGGRVRATEPMACLARQVGQFVLVREVQPGPAALAFLAARCGVSDSGIGTSSIVQPLSGGETDEALFARLRAPVGDMLHEALEEGPQVAGVWYGRSARRALALTVHVSPMARLDGYPERPGADGALVISGELLRPAARLHGIVTRGRHGFRPCTVDAGVALPRFRLRCEIERDDPWAMLEIGAFEEGRIFGPVVVSARVWPKGDPPATFVRPRLKAHGPVDGDLPATLVTLLNRVRAEARLAPVSLVRDQSQTAAALAPQFFGAALQGDDRAQETIVLGLRAGWQVPGLVRSGLFTSIRSDDLGDAGRLLALALERPSGRETLLHPEVRAVAVGTVREPRAVGAIFSTYALVEPAQAEVEADAVLRRIDRERAKRSKVPVRPLPELSRETAALAAAVERGDKTPKQAVQELVAAAKGSLRGGYVQSWIGFGERLDEIALPPLLLEPDDLRVSVAVARFRAEGSPWATYCVLVATFDRSPRKEQPERKDTIKAEMESGRSLGIARLESSSARPELVEGSP
jgi:hypothetical protein